MSVASVLEGILKKSSSTVLTRVEHVPPREAVFENWPEELDPRLRESLFRRGRPYPYSHQAEAVRQAMAGRHVVVVTPTASGKTLCYNVPVLQSILRDSGSTALYLFPTKALAQDQLAELQQSIDDLGAAVGTFTYDGDTPADARRAVRSRAHVVITNPDMLHTGILPHHTRWARFFANLRYVVLDELHTCRGVFGSHLANVLRRLRRICEFHGSHPVFIASSATIANPQELASRLVGEEVLLVDRNGAPSGPRTILFYNPPMLNKELGIRRSCLTASRNLAARFLKGGVQTLVFASSRLNVEVLTRALKDRFERHPSDEGRIRGYRGGYLPGARREIERGIRDGSVRAVISTNALELGIDIGALEAVILAGYPGTVASTWQQVGRAGRRQGESVAILVARSEPLDQFIVEHPDYFFGSTPEHARINPDNLAILVSHLKCAAFELPLQEGERFGDAPVGEIVEYLAEKGVLHRSGDEFHWSQDVYPADTISLRSSSPENFVIMDMEAANRVIAEVDWHAAPTTVYEDAIYMAHARTYNVKKLDYAQRRAYVKPVAVDYYTDAITANSVRVLEGFERVPCGPVLREHGEVHVAWRVSGFKKVKFDTRENVGFGEVHLPDQEMHTTSFWFTMPDEFLAGLDLTRSDLLDGVVGLAHCLHHLAPVFLMCDVRDLNRCVGDRTGEWFAQPDGRSRGRYEFVTEVPLEVPADPWMRTPVSVSEPSGLQRLQALPRFEPTVFLYDNFPGGIGFSSQLFDSFPELLSRVGDRIRDCACEAGCPSCVGPPQEVGNQAREVAGRLVQAILTSPLGGT